MVCLLPTTIFAELSEPLTCPEATGWRKLRQHGFRSHGRLTHQANTLPHLAEASFSHLLDLAHAHGTILSEVLTAGVRVRINDRTALEMLMRRLVYEEADYMPLYRRMLRQRSERLLNG